MISWHSSTLVIHVISSSGTMGVLLIRERTMRTTVKKKALIVRTDKDMTYMFEDLDGKDPGIRMKNVVSILSEKGPFLQCVDTFGEMHYINVNHIIEIFVGTYSVTEVRPE